MYTVVYRQFQEVDRQRSRLPIYWFIRRSRATVAIGISQRTPTSQKKRKKKLLRFSADSTVFVRRLILITWTANTTISWKIAAGAYVIVSQKTLKTNLLNEHWLNKIAKKSRGSGNCDSDGISVRYESTRRLRWRIEPLRSRRCDSISKARGKEN